MIRHSCYQVDPWCIRETSLDFDVLAESESLFALSNGHIGLRANLDEGEPHGTPGTYLNSFYELRTLPYAEAGYGYPEAGQAIVNVTNGKLMRMLVDDEPFDVRYGQLRAHERVLDLRAGTLERWVEWESPAGKALRVHSTRLVSFTHRAIAALCYEVEAVARSARIIVQSELVANERPSVPGDNDDDVIEAPLAPLEHFAGHTNATLVHLTPRSQLRIAAGMDHVIDGPPGTTVTTESQPDWARTTVSCVLEPGQSLRIIKFLGYGWSSQRSRDALRDQVHGALAGARFTGWDDVLQAQRDYLDTFWDTADVELDGDPEVQQAVRFGLFHVLQAGARAEKRPIGSKGLTGPGHNGHAFWNTEMFVLPVLTYTLPSAARDALYWRHATIDLARDRAHILNLAGAAFPWRTIGGHECSAYWPAGTASFHVGADIADAALRYINATGDNDFAASVGLELLVETARLWLSLGHHDRQGRFHIDGVTGPDTYSALANDNIYTNLMAQRNLLGAADTVRRFPESAKAFGAQPEEVAAWRKAAAAIHLPYDKEMEVHQQAQDFTRYQEWDFATTGPEKYPLHQHFPYFRLYSRQVVKQADLVLAMHWRGDAFTDDQKIRNFAYYDSCTVRDSTLSACTQAVIAAEVGQLELAHDYVTNAALFGLHDPERDTRIGVDVSSMAGVWIALVAGFGGMRDHDGQLSFAPRLPNRISRLEFSIIWRGHHLRVVALPHEVTYVLRDGNSDAKIELLHHDVPVTVTTSDRATMPIPPAPPTGPAPAQPAGRELQPRDAA